MGYRKIVHTYADGGRTLLEAGDEADGTNGFALVDDVLRMWEVCIDGTAEEIAELARELNAEYSDSDDDDE